MTTSPDTSASVGKTVYLEFRNSSGLSVVQFFMTPTARIPSNPSVVVDPTIYRRQLTASMPKRQWRTFTMHAANFVENFKTEERLTVHTTNYFGRLANGGFALVKEPIVVDTSADDLADIRALRTPYKLLGRIQKVRKAKGFPEKVLS